MTVDRLGLLHPHDKLNSSTGQGLPKADECPCVRSRERPRRPCGEEGLELAPEVYVNASQLSGSGAGTPSGATFFLTVLQASGTKER